MDKSLEAQKAHAEKEISQLENRQKILLNRIRKEERNARTSRLCRHGAILEGVFPAVLDADGEAIKAFLIALFTKGFLNYGYEPMGTPPEDFGGSVPPAA